MLNKLGIKSKEKKATNNLKKLDVIFKEIEIEELQEKIIGGDAFYQRKPANKIGRF